MTTTTPIPLDLTTFGQLPQAYAKGRIDSALMTVWGWLSFDVADSLYIPNHVELAKGRLVEQFKVERKVGAFATKPEKINKIIEGLVLSAQDVEDVANDLSILRWLSSARAAQLDGIGKIVGIVRGAGESDDSYRISINFQIFINASKGEPETLIRFCKFLTDTPTVSIREVWPASVEIGINADYIPSDFGDRIVEIAPAGVALSVVNVAGEPPLSFDWDGMTIERGAGLNEEGYTESGEEVGGIISERIN